MGIKQTIEGLFKSARSLWSSPQYQVVATPKRDYEDIRKVNAALLPLLSLGLIAAIWVAWRATAVGPVLLWCVSCLAVGATVGFLFGIPRAGAHVAAQRTAKDSAKPEPKAPPSEQGMELGRPNTNLEEVSDWLTKIIVGLTLVNLGKIESRVMAISRNAAASLHATPSNADLSAATALVVGFAVIGFLCGYLYTRLFLQGAFSRSNFDMVRFTAVVAAELSHTPSETAPPSGQPSVPSPLDRQAAERVLRATPADQPDAALAPLRGLAVEYERVRQDMPFGRERTRKMSEIASRMKRLALAAAPYLPQLAKSASPGERLAAVTILQMQFDPAYIEWLSDRLVEEVAFIGYQAASAMLARVRIVGGTERLQIKNAVESAIRKGIKPEVERDRLVDEILNEASR